MKYLGLIFLSIATFFVFNNKNSSDTINPLQNTKWIYSYDEKVADSLIFKDSTYTSYRAELGDWYYGEFYAKKDTIYLHRSGQIIMYEPPKRIPLESNTKARAIIDSNGALRFISPLKYENGQWIDTGFKFNEDYYFTKLEFSK